MTAGQTAQFNAADYKPSYEEYIAKNGSAVSWTSSDPSVATVDANGRVTAKAAGETVITCKIGSGSATLKVKVTAASSVPSSSSSSSASECRHVNQETQTTPATCGKAGSTKVTCKDCGAVLQETTIPATGQHTWGEWQETPATCGAAGSKTRTCTVCNTTETQAIPATGQHQVDPATGICSVCGQQITQPPAPDPEPDPNPGGTEQGGTNPDGTGTTIPEGAPAG